MIVDIEISRRADGHYIARALHVPHIIIEAASRDAVLEQMRSVLRARQYAGIELVQMDIDDSISDNRGEWPHHAGAFPDAAAYQAMLAEIKQYRQILDSDSNL